MFLNWKKEFEINVLIAILARGLKWLFLPEVTKFLIVIKAFKFNDLSNHVGLLPDILTVSVGKRNENLKISQPNAYKYITWGSRHWLIWIFLQESLELLTVTSMIWLDQGAQQGSQVFLWVYTSRLTVTAPGQNDR